MGSARAYQRWEGGNCQRISESVGIPLFIWGFFVYSGMSLPGFKCTWFGACLRVYEMESSPRNANRTMAVNGMGRSCLLWKSSILESLQCSVFMCHVCCSWWHWLTCNPGSHKTGMPYSMEGSVPGSHRVSAPGTHTCGTFSRVIPPVHANRYRIFFHRQKILFMITHGWCIWNTAILMSCSLSVSLEAFGRKWFARV